MDERLDEWQAREVERLRETPRRIAERLADGTLTLEPVNPAEDDRCQIGSCDELALVTARFSSPSGTRGFLRACGRHTMQALYDTHRAR